MSRTLLDCLAERYPTAKRTTLRRMIQAGRVRINDVVAKSANQKIEVSDRLTADDRPSNKPAARQEISALSIVYEDNDVLVANKPAGLLTATNAREKRQTLLALVREHVRAQHPRAQVGLIHRLDRDAAGLLVFSKNHQAYLSLKQQFFQHSVHREYLAVVHGVPKEASGRIESRLVERADGTVHATREAGRGELAISHYSVVKAVGKRALVKIILETGKKHQIRVHLNSIGHPIVGDPVYGPPADSTPLMLAATQLGFAHPRDGRPMKLEIEPPPYFEIKKA
ncbi:MAG TPA: RluA family pseudouridine synthase [Tepidisphaeraceae bacterium]|nr:RluA family pseudouridine synthase [Tepidisphaeraceae bacterium]